MGLWLKVVCQSSGVVSVASGRSSKLGASPLMKDESYCLSAGRLKGRKEEGVSGGARRVRLWWAHPNKSLEPTASKAALMRQLGWLVNCMRGG